MRFTQDKYPYKFVRVRQEEECDLDSWVQEEREEFILLQDYLKKVYTKEHEFIHYHKEVETGKVEYKEMLLNMTKSKFLSRVN